ncbi:MGMT family protein [Pelagicoccus sp. SDUM812002]|uniref:MGMT family protein n=1 Tax=Pelagicoccus sp. SDUM812002 TaxID=3041266 RepID=UPI00280D1998|nr:MGMT family protein [Pelagicoccus sp. SDUM812002]MDQ8185031.1 MGMT family protein [Pelagicoccus sp. SDUM812002]
MDDQIEQIPKTMETFFGTAGKMVKPSVETVDAWIGKIPKGQLCTIDELRCSIAASFAVERACPASTTKALKILSKEKPDSPYWRVVKKKGELISQFANGIEGHAKKLEVEGFAIDYAKKKPVVKTDPSHFHKFT